MPSTLAADTFTRPLASLDDAAARIGAAVTFAAERIAGRTVPADLAFELTFARETLSEISAIRSTRARAAAFLAEHGTETLKGLSYAFADHAELLGLELAA